MSDTSGGKGKPDQTGPKPDTPRPEAARPRPPVIDLEARDVSPEKPKPASTASSTPPKPEAPRSEPAKPAAGTTTPPKQPLASDGPKAAEPAKATAAKDDKPAVKPGNPVKGSTSSGTLAGALGGAALAVLIVYGLAAMGWLPASGTGRTDQLQADIDRIRADVASLPEPARPEPDPRIGDLEQRLAALEERSAPQSASGEAAPVNLAPLETRIRDLESRLNALAAQAGDAAAGNNAADALAQRLDALQAEVQALDRGVDDPVARALAASGAVQAALWRGAPFKQELALATAAAPGTEIPVLARAAPAGLPTAGVIAAKFRAALENVPPPPPPADASTLDRLWSNARNLVKVTPLGEPEGEDEPALRARIIAALERQDLSSAMELWERLAPATRAATEEVAAIARQRVDAEREAASLSSAILDATREQAGTQ